MSDEIARRDANRIATLLGVGNDAAAEVLRVLLDATSKRLLVDSLSKNDGYESIGVDNGTVATAGTAVQLVNHSCKRVIISASEANGDLTNGGVVVIGDENVVAASVGRKGVTLFPGQSQVFNVSNTNLLYIDSTDDGAKINFYFEN